MFVSAQLADTDWKRFIRRLEHWGRAGRGLHGPKGLGNPGRDAEQIAEWGPNDDEMEALITGQLSIRGDGRVAALIYYYVYDMSDSSAGGKMRLTRPSYQLFRMETERVLFDIWQENR